MPNPKPTGPLSEAEIIAALQRSGYPLEIRLLQTFHDAGFDPQIGLRFMLAEENTSAEVDLTAYARGALANWKGNVYLKAVVEAKQLIERRVFVGLKWTQPEKHDMRAARIRFAGTPTCQVLDGVDGQMSQLMLGPPGPVAEALDPLNEPPLCVHWAYVQDSKDVAQLGQMARQDDEHRASFTKLVRVVSWLERNSAEFLRRAPGQPPLLQIQLLLPTIILGTPHLYIFDSNSKQLETVDSLVLRQMYEAGGRVHARLVDVVTEAGVASLIDRYRRAADALTRLCNKHVGALLDIAREQCLSEPTAEPGSDPPDGGTGIDPYSEAFRERT